MPLGSRPSRSRQAGRRPTSSTSSTSACRRLHPGGSSRQPFTTPSSRTATAWLASGGPTRASSTPGPRGENGARRGLVLREGRGGALLRRRPGAGARAVLGPWLTEDPSEEPSREPPRGPFLVYVGGLAPNKGLGHLVRVFDRAKVDARLVLVGRPAMSAPSSSVRSRLPPPALSRDRHRRDRRGRRPPVPSGRRSRASLGVRGLRVHPPRGDGARLPGSSKRHPAIRVSSRQAPSCCCWGRRCMGHAIARIFADPSLRASLRERGR